MRESASPRIVRMTKIVSPMRFIFMINLPAFSLQKTRAIKTGHAIMDAATHRRPHIQCLRNATAMIPILHKAMPIKIPRPASQITNVSNASPRVSFGVGPVAQPLLAVRFSQLSRVQHAIDRQNRTAKSGCATSDSAPIRVFFFAEPLFIPGE
jgi:hypothetical protein